LPPEQIFLEKKKIPRSERKTIKQLKNTPEEKLTHRKRIKWKYNFQEEKSSPQK
jgi:hypothetical protein